jgi:hypothetical protein
MASEALFVRKKLRDCTDVDRQCAIAAIWVSKQTSKQTRHSLSLLACSERKQTNNKHSPLVLASCACLQGAGKQTNKQPRTALLVIACLQREEANKQQTLSPCAFFAASKQTNKQTRHSL